LPSPADAKAAMAAVSQEEKVAVAVVKQGETVAIAEAPAGREEKVAVMGPGGEAAGVAESLDVGATGGEGDEAAGGAAGAGFAAAGGAAGEGFAGAGGAAGEVKGTEGFAAAVKKSKGEAGGPGALLAPEPAGGLAAPGLAGGELALGEEGVVAQKTITVAFGSPRQFSGGEFDRQKLRDVLAAGPEELPACFKDELLESDHHSNLNYVVRVQVGADGKATATVAEDYMGEAKAGACALEVIGGWEFPVGVGGEGSFLITMVVRRS
jgi:hypothetical protein